MEYTAKRFVDTLVDKVRSEIREDNPRMGYSDVEELVEFYCDKIAEKLAKDLLEQVR